MQSAKDTALTFLQVNGTYSYNITLIPEYFTLVSPRTGTIDINGSTVSSVVKFLPENFTLNFTETSLPQYTNWSIGLTGLRTLQ
ncbi:hypothetical protein GCM10007108_02950 [Thermogymnomonas acidicola]|uniref:Uncharacterized protein n=1 Tax=Thermogymnomonas acidicola TaxID=399579 RepID=A0AA37BQ54_9ARCH|nr:hypothetical protein GCM10007108_02950 [Thermogymnomonas acidicola]